MLMMHATVLVPCTSKAADPDLFVASNQSVCRCTSLFEHQFRCGLRGPTLCTAACAHVFRALVEGHTGLRGGLPLVDEVVTELVQAQACASVWHMGQEGGL